MGDFNQTKCVVEKKGGRPSPLNPMNSFVHMIRECALIDLGFSGPPFTWTNMRKGEANIQEWLDRALANSSWLERFGDSQVIHLPRTRSDHNPLLLQSITTPKQ